MTMRNTHRPPPSRILDDHHSQTTTQLASQIHKVIRDGEFQKLPALVSSSSSILWHENQVGYTALHYAASHFLPLEWWEWMLKQAGSKKEKFRKQRNALGETVIDVFLKSYLHPYPWQSLSVKKRSKFLREAIQKVVLQQQTPQQQLLKDVQAGIANPKFNCLEYDIVVARCVTFWINLSRLADDDILLFLAQSGSCPALLGRLALAMDDRSSRDLVNVMEAWAASSSCNELDDMLPCLLEAVDLQQQDLTKAMKMALASGKPWHKVKPLYQNHLGSDALVIAALAPRVPNATIRARRKSAGDKGLMTLWNLLSTEARTQKIIEAEQEIDVEQLNTLYEMIRMCPQVLNYRHG